MNDRETRYAIDGEVLYRHQVKHWEVVSDDHEGSMFSVSSAQERFPEDARKRALDWLRPGYHLEVREQVWWSTEAEWTTVECANERSITVLGD